MPEADRKGPDLGKEMGVALYRLLKKNAFEPEDIGLLATAFDGAMSKLLVADRTGPVAELLARRIILLAQQGRRDLQELCDCAVEGRFAAMFQAGAARSA